MGRNVYEAPRAEVLEVGIELGIAATVVGSSVTEKFECDPEHVTL